MIDLLKDPDRKPLYKIFTELTYLTFIYRAFPRHYFSRYLFKKGRSNIKNYFPANFLYKIKPFFNENEIREVLENKLYFDFYYGQFNISLPKIIMYNYRKLFVVNKISLEINSASDFKSLIEKIFKENPAFDSIFVKKTYWSYGGNKVYKIVRDEVVSDPEKIDNLYSEVIKSGFLFQETIKQHSALNSLNPSCLNTLRIDTFIDKNGEIEIISGLIRMSTSNSHIDNISSGGCSVGIDINTGNLNKEGYLSFGSHGVKTLTVHPITNTIFEDFTIPFLSEAKELVLKAASLMPGLRLVGWDVAIGESGPVLIEGNSDYDISGSDLNYGGYRANAVFRKILHEINYI